jgi:hypothetical protein
VNPKIGIALAFRKWKRSVVFMKFHGSFRYSPSLSPSPSLAMSLSRANSTAPAPAPTASASGPLSASASAVGGSPQTPQQRKATALETAYSFDFDAPSTPSVATGGAGGGWAAAGLPMELVRTLSQIASSPGATGGAAGGPVMQADGLYGTLMGTLNIRKDPDGCVDLIGTLLSLPSHSSSALLSCVLLFSSPSSVPPSMALPPPCRSLH